MTTPTPADAIRAAIGALPPNITREEIAATVLCVAADKILPCSITGDQSRRADRYRLLRLQFLTAAGDLAGNTVPVESRETLAETREESQDAAWDGIEPGPYSEHDLRQIWNARSAENWEDLESYEQLAFAQTQAIEADRRRAEPIAWCCSDDFADAAKKQQSFSGWRERHSDCDMALYGVPVVASRAEPATARLRHCPTHGQQGPETWGCPECLRELRTELTTAREALCRLVDWGGFQAWHDAAAGFDAETVTAVLDWFANGMTGPLPPLPPHIASRETVTEPTLSAPALPPALARDGGDGVRISAANLERSCWVVWREIIPDREFLCTDGQWCMEPRSRDFDEAFLIRTRWPSAAAAWEALQRSRAVEGVEG